MLVVLKICVLIALSFQLYLIAARPLDLDVPVTPSTIKRRAGLDSNTSQNATDSDDEIVCSAYDVEGWNICRNCSTPGNTTESAVGVRTRNTPNILGKRKLDSPARFSSMDDFMQFTSLRSEVMPKGNYLYPTTAIWQRFNHEDYKIGMKLGGCSSLVVASRSGVYITHYFQYPSMRTNPPSTQEHQELLFRNQILSTLEANVYPVGQKGKKKLEIINALQPLVSKRAGQIQATGILFAPDNNVQAMLISPRKSQSHVKQNFEFLYYVQQLREKVRSILPESAVIKIQDYLRPTDLADYKFWKKRMDSSSLMDWIRGHAIDKMYFQYSPHQGYELYLGTDLTPIMSDYWNRTELPPLPPTFGPPVVAPLVSRPPPVRTWNNQSSEPNAPNNTGANSPQSNVTNPNTPHSFPGFLFRRPSNPSRSSLSQSGAPPNTPPRHHRRPSGGFVNWFHKTKNITEAD